jgi:FtsH-binding integral membrane protein
MGGNPIMATCVRCQVTLEPTLSHCPVCGSFVQHVDANQLETLYPTPDYQKLEKKTANTLHHVFAFPLILALLITLLIDLALIANELGTTFLMTFIVFYAWILIYKSIFNRQGLGYLLLWQWFGLSLGTTMLAFVANNTFNAWPLQYVVPILTAVMNLIFFIVTTTHRKTDVMLFQMLVAALLGLGQFSLIFWLIPSVTAPSLIAGLTSMLSFGALFTYLRKKFFDYIQRWLHI